MNIKNRSNNRRVLLLYIFLGVSVAVVITFAALLARELITIKQGQSYYSDLSAGIERRPATPGGPSTASPAQPGGEAYNTENSGGTGNDWVPYVDFDSLDERFPGIVGWIKLEGTAIDYPIMHWTDNYYFLGHLPDGTRHRQGSIFIDYRNSPDFSDKHTKIYGHDSRTQDMFGVLKNYAGQSFFEENPIVRIFTPERDYQLMLFAGYHVDSGVEVPPLTFSDDAAFEAYIADIKSRSIFRSNVEVSADDKIVSLCTCAAGQPTARLVIVGKLVGFDSRHPSGE